MTNIVIDNVDLELLNEQRLLLIDKIWNEEDSKLWGLVEMLSHIFDTYRVED